MGASVSRNSFDYKPVEIVPVIAGFDNDGKIIPLFVKLDGEKIKIDSYWVKSRFAGITEFRCKIIREDVMYPLVLTFYSEESVWTIPKR